MKNQIPSGSVDQQYLKAMGIDLWIERDAVVVAPDSVAVAAATQSAANAVQQVAIDQHALKSLASGSAAEFVSAIDVLKIVSDHKLRAAELLVLTEEATLSEECRALLGSMFKAIELDESQWLHAGISTGSVADTMADTMTNVEKSVSPGAVLVMLKPGSDTNDLSQLRGLQHRPASLQTIVAVTFHPQDLINNPQLKRPAWEDLKQLRQWLTPA